MHEEAILAATVNKLLQAHNQRRNQKSERVDPCNDCTRLRCCRSQLCKKWLTGPGDRSEPQQGIEVRRLGAQQGIEVRHPGPQQGIEVRGDV